MKKIRKYLSYLDNDYFKGFIIGLTFPSSLLFYFVYRAGTWLYVTEKERAVDNEQINL